MGSLFDGIGGFPLLWQERNGADSVRWVSEIDEFCNAVTAGRFGDDT
jgi:DNA (cytosine-5)-methyltransferase 1